MSSEEFDKMKYRIHSLPLEVNLFNEFPELKQIKGLRTKAADNQKVLRAGFYLYDPKSPLIKNIAQFRDRKEQALTLAGYKKVDGAWETEALEILQDKNEDVRMVFFTISTSVYHDRKFREYHTLFQELNEYTRLRWEPVKGDDKLGDAKLKTSLRDQCTSIHDLLDAAEKEIWGDDEETKTKVEEIMLTSPERVALAYAKDYENEEVEHG